MACLPVLRARDRPADRGRAPPAAPTRERPGAHLLTDRTLVLVKPDAFARGLTGEIIRRFEAKALRIVAMRHMTVTRELAERLYAEHDGKPFFAGLVSFVTSGPLVALVLEGQDAVRAARQVIGATDPLEAAPGSIRGDFAIAAERNMVHGSDSAESAEREAGLFFSRD